MKSFTLFSLLPSFLLFLNFIFHMNIFIFRSFESIITIGRIYYLRRVTPHYILRPLHLFLSLFILWPCFCSIFSVSYLLFLPIFLVKIFVFFSLLRKFKWNYTLRIMKERENGRKERKRRGIKKERKKEKEWREKKIYKKR